MNVLACSGVPRHLDADSFEGLLRPRRLQEFVQRRIDFAITGWGVRTGASIAYHTLASNPDNPASSAVATSGKPANRTALAIARPRNLPAARCYVGGYRFIARSICPPSKSVMIAVLPRYWVSANLICARFCNSLPVMWPSVPLPGNPAVNLSDSILQNR